jgi:hypothetical protein
MYDSHDKLLAMKQYHHIRGKGEVGLVHEYHRRNSGPLLKDSIVSKCPLYVVSSL